MYPKVEKLAENWSSFYREEQLKEKCPKSPEKCFLLLKFCGEKLVFDKTWSKKCESITSEYLNFFVLIKTLTSFQVKFSNNLKKSNLHACCFGFSRICLNFND